MKQKILSEQIKRLSKQMEELTKEKSEVDDNIKIQRILDGIKQKKKKPNYKKGCKQHEEKDMTKAILKTVESKVINIDTGNTGRNIHVNFVTDIGGIKVYISDDGPSTDEKRLFFILNNEVIKVMDVSADADEFEEEFFPVFEFFNVDDLY